MTWEWTSDQPLRDWQERCLTKYQIHRSKDFLLVGTPGCGKTTMALKIAHELMRNGRIVRVLVVVHSENLKYQWAAEAAKVGLHLDPAWTNGTKVLATDYHGACLTYGQVASNPHDARGIAGMASVPTLVILDEIHHAGESRSWGDSLRTAFDPAAFRLCLSGTPFRTDNNPIPFVRYDENGCSQADFTYLYSEALTDCVCRPVLFPSYEGYMEWYSRGKRFEASFSDDLSGSRAAQRLKTALDPSGLWIPEVFGDADRKLSQLRGSHSDAGGLILATDTWYADEYAKIMKSISGESPVVVHCDEPGSNRLIKEFNRGSQRWIVAIKMVSEGVDIKRLRTGIYATNVLTELFFRQAVGRVVRWLEGLEDQTAYWYIPKEPFLINCALQIMMERQHQLEEELEEIRDPKGDEGKDDKVASVFVPISSTGQPDDVIGPEQSVTQAEIREAENILRDIKGSFFVDSALFAMFLRKSRERDGRRAPDADPTSTRNKPGPDPRHVQKEKLKRIIRRLVSQIVLLTNEKITYKDVFKRLAGRDQVYQGEATVDHLNARVVYLENWIKELINAR